MERDMITTEHAMIVKKHLTFMKETAIDQNFKFPEVYKKYLDALERFIDDRHYFATVAPSYIQNNHLVKKFIQRYKEEEL